MTVAIIQPKVALDRHLAAAHRILSDHMLWPSPGCQGTKKPSDPPHHAEAGPAEAGESEQRVHIIDGSSRIVWSSTNCGRRAGLHGAIDQIWPRDVARQIEAELRTVSATASARFVAVTGCNQQKRWWDMLLARVAGDSPGLEQYVLTARDVTGERAVAAARLDAAVRDQLTGLLNRTCFLHQIEQIIAQPNEPPPFAVLKIDIDAFRQHNDVFGQSAGDAILKVLAKRLLGQVRRQDIVARVSGDTFGVVIRNVTGVAECEVTARRLMKSLARPLQFGKDRFSLTVSIGLAMFPDQGRSLDDLCRNAGMALKLAQSTGRGTLVCVRSDMREAADECGRMIGLASAALQASRILPYYQPKVDLQTGHIIGFEALLRWRATDGTLGMPAQIWAAFDDPALSCQITQVMVRQVIADLVRWRRHEVYPTVAINVSDADLRQKMFAEGLLTRLSADNISCSQIEIEVTESVFVGRDPSQMLATLNALNAAGVRIALDDFGTGHASLTHLRNFPADTIKIDRSFIDNMASDPGDRAIVEAILGLAAALSIEVVAEGIERADDAAFLASRGCDLGQGFLFGRAVAAASVPALMSRAMPWRPARVQPKHRMPA